MGSHRLMQVTVSDSAYDLKCLLDTASGFLTDGKWAEFAGNVRGLMDRAIAEHTRWYVVTAAVMGRSASVKIKCSVKPTCVVEDLVAVQEGDIKYLEHVIATHGLKLDPDEHGPGAFFPPTSILEVLIQPMQEEAETPCDAGSK